jgi:hypothetical protein
MALIDKASLLMVPSTYEAGKLYNVLPSGNRAPDSTGENSGYDQTRADFDFDRGSNTAATRVNADGLIEKYRENEALQSNSFNVSPWSLGNSVLTANATTSPTGESNAAKIESSTIGTETRVRQSISGATTGKVFTFSCYMKAGNVSWGIVRHYGISSNGRAWFNLENGTIGAQDSSLIDAKIESVGDGWYRCSITGQITTSGAFDLAPAPKDNDYLSDAVGDYIFLYGSQAESSMVATDYLESTSVTGKAGLLIDLPRIDYSSGAGALLLEPQRSNVVQYSEYFGSYSKVTSDATAVPVVTDNYSISPEGIKNAARVVVTKPGTDNDYAVVREAKVVTKTSGDKMSQSVYLKATDAAQVGKIVDIYAYDGSYLSVENHTLTSEWKRIEVVHTASTGTSNTEMVIGKARGWAGGTTLANMATDFLIYGHQFENGASYPSSYIPNHGESGGVTRAADAGVSDVDSLLTSNATYTWFVEFIVPDSGIGGGEITLKDAGGSSQLRIYCNQNNTIGLRVEDGGQTHLINVSVGDTAKCLFQCSNGLVKGFYNGSLVHTFSIDTGMDAQKIHLGPPISAPNVKQVMLFNEALTDAECITLTTA